VCCTETVGCFLEMPADPGGVMGSCGANVDRKCVFKPVSSLGSGSIRGSISACCAYKISDVLSNMCLNIVGMHSKRPVRGYPVHCASDMRRLQGTDRPVSHDRVFRRNENLQPPCSWCYRDLKCYSLNADWSKLEYRGR
jgi:hypothetical protein